MLYELKNDYESLTLIDKISNIVTIMLMITVSAVRIFSRSIVTVDLLWKDITRFYDINSVIKPIVVEIVDGLMMR